MFVYSFFLLLNGAKVINCHKIWVFYRNLCKTCISFLILTTSFICLKVNTVKKSGELEWSTYGAKSTLTTTDRPHIDMCAAYSELILE